MKGSSMTSLSRGGKVGVQLIAPGYYSGLASKKQILLASTKANNSSALFVSLAAALLPTSQGSKKQLLKAILLKESNSPEVIGESVKLATLYSTTIRNWYTSSLFNNDAKGLVGSFSLLAGVSEYGISRSYAKDGSANKMQPLLGDDFDQFRDILKDCINAIFLDKKGNVSIGITNVSTDPLSVDYNAGLIFDGVRESFENGSCFQVIKPFLDLRGIDLSATVGKSNKVAKNIANRAELSYISECMVGIVYSAILDGLLASGLFSGDNNGKDSSKIIEVTNDNAIRIVSFGKEGQSGRLGDTSQGLKSLIGSMDALIGKAANDSKSAKALMDLNKLLVQLHSGRAQLVRFYKNRDTFLAEGYSSNDKLLDAYNVMMGKLSTVSGVELAGAAIQDFLSESSFTSSLAGILYNQTIVLGTENSELLDALTDVAIDSELVRAFNSSPAGKFVKAEIDNKLHGFPSLPFTGNSFSLTYTKETSLDLTEQGVLNSVNSMEFGELLRHSGVGRFSSKDKYIADKNVDFYALLAQTSLSSDEIRSLILRGISGNNISEPYKLSQNVRNEHMAQVAQITAAVTTQFAVYRLSNRLWAYEYLSAIRDALTATTVIFSMKNHHTIIDSRRDKAVERAKDLMDMCELGLKTLVPEASVLKDPIGSGLGIPKIKVNNNDDLSLSVELIVEALSKNSGWLSFKDKISSIIRTAEYSIQSKKDIVKTSYVHELDDKYFTSVYSMLLKQGDLGNKIELRTILEHLMTIDEVTSFRERLLRDHASAKFSFFEDVNNMSKFVDLRDASANNYSIDYLNGISEKISQMPPFIKRLMFTHMRSKMSVLLYDESLSLERYSRATYNYGASVVALLSLAGSPFEGLSFNRPAIPQVIPTTSDAHTIDSILGTIGLSPDKMMTFKQFTAIGSIIRSMKNSPSFPFEEAKVSIDAFAEGKRVAMRDCVQLKKTFKISNAVNDTVTIYLRDINMVYAMFGDSIFTDFTSTSELLTFDQEGKNIFGQSEDGTSINIYGSIEVPINMPIYDSHIKELAYGIVEELSSLIMSNAHVEPGKSSKDPEGNEEEDPALE